MTTLDDLPVFENIDKSTRFLGRGAHGRVYAINAGLNLAAKVWIDPFIPQRNLFSSTHIPAAEHEYMIARELYDAGISVPKPEGVYALTLPCLLPLRARISSFVFRRHLPDDYRVPAFVMERIHGKAYHKLSEKEKSKARELHLLEMEKVSATGITPSDQSIAHNCLYRIDDDKVFLLDFGGWCKKR